MSKLQNCIFNYAYVNKFKNLTRDFYTSYQYGQHWSVIIFLAHMHTRAHTQINIRHISFYTCFVETMYWNKRLFTDPWPDTVE
jgi:hypothetical protein